MAVNSPVPRRPRAPRVRPQTPPPSAPQLPGGPHSHAETQRATEPQRPVGPARRPVLVLAAAATGLLALPSAGVLVWQRRRSNAVSPAEQTSTFSDVAAGHPAAAAVAWADATGVQPALDDGSYGPNLEVTRGQLAIALHRLAGAPALPVAEAPVLLADVPDDPEGAAAVLWLHGRGALWGDAELRVHPDRSTSLAHTRQVLTLLLEPAVTAAGKGPGILAGALDPITDAGPSRRDDRASLTRADLALCLHRAVAALD